MGLLFIKYLLPLLLSTYFYVLYIYIYKFCWEPNDFYKKNFLLNMEIYILHIVILKTGFNLLINDPNNIKSLIFIIIISN